MRRVGLGDDEHPAGALVEAMDEARSLPPVVTIGGRLGDARSPEVMHQPVQQRAGPVARRRVHHEPRRLVHDQELIVFVEHLDRDRLREDGGQCAHGHVTDDDVAGTDPSSRLARLAVDGDHAARDPALRQGSRDVSVLGAYEDVEPPRRLPGRHHCHAPSVPVRQSAISARTRAMADRARTIGHPPAAAFARAFMASE